MRTRFLWITLFLASVLLIAGCQAADPPALAVPPGAQAGDLTGLEPCEYRPLDSKAKYSAECGTLAVPENWEKAGSRLIALPVVRIPARGPQPAEPVFYLQGGPGQSNLSWAPPDWLLAEHDLVFVGYRGIDGTTRLACPELNRPLKAHLGKDFFSDQAQAEYAAAVRQCAASHQHAGVDLSGYTVPAVIQDMEAARAALGYARINLLSESYGTRVAQIYAYLHPESLHRAVLVAVNPPGRFVDDPAAFDRIIENLSRLCAQDASCSRRTSDFAQTLYAVNHNMPERWLFFKIDPGTVRLGAHFMFMSNQNMAQVFDAYLAAAEGDPSGLAMANLYMSRIPIDQILVLGDSFSKAGSLDQEAYGGIETVRLGDSIMGAPGSELSWPMAAGWPVELADPALRRLQHSDVEMLLVNGTLDFATPAASLDEVRPYYPRAQMVLLPEFSHTPDVMTLQPEAFERLLTSYYDTGVADDSLYVYQPLSFEPGLSLGLMARLLVAALVTLPALLILGAVFAARRLGRRRTGRKHPLPA